MKQTDRLKLLTAFLVQENFPEHCTSEPFNSVAKSFHMLLRYIKALSSSEHCRSHLASNQCDDIYNHLLSDHIINKNALGVHTIVLFNVKVLFRLLSRICECSRVGNSYERLVNVDMLHRDFGYVRFLELGDVLRMVHFTPKLCDVYRMCFIPFDYASATLRFINQLYQLSCSGAAGLSTPDTLTTHLSLSLELNRTRAD